MYAKQNCCQKWQEDIERFDLKNVDLFEKKLFEKEIERDLAKFRP